MADMQIDKYGEDVGYIERLEDIKKYGEYSDRSIKGAVISNGIVHDEVIEIIKKYIIEE